MSWFIHWNDQLWSTYNFHDQKASPSIEHKFFASPFQLHLPSCCFWETGDLEFAGLTSHQELQQAFCDILLCTKCAQQDDVTQKCRHYCSDILIWGQNYGFCNLIYLRVLSKNWSITMDCITFMWRHQPVSSCDGPQLPIRTVLFRMGVLQPASWPKMKKYLTKSGDTPLLVGAWQAIKGGQQFPVEEENYQMLSFFLSSRNPL